MCLGLILLAYVVFIIEICEARRHGQNLTENFTRVYKRKMWGAEGDGSGGSSTMKATVGIRRYLADLIIKMNFTSFLDAPCGSMHWMPSVLIDVESRLSGKPFKFVGVDVVPYLMEQMRVKFAHHANWTFRATDITAEPLHESFDLIMSRDVFFHLTFDKIKCALNFFSASGSKYLLATSYKGAENSATSVKTVIKQELNEGGYRDVDMTAKPLFLPPPSEVFKEYSEERIMGLWTLPLPWKYDRGSDGNALVCT